MLFVNLKLKSIFISFLIIILFSSYVLADTSFNENFVFGDLIQSQSNVAMSSSVIEPTLQITGSTINADSSTVALFHFNRDVSKGENDVYAYDWSGNSNTGELDDCTYGSTNPKFDSYLHFDDEYDRFLISNLKNTFSGDQATFSMWFRNNDADNTYQSIFRMGNFFPRITGSTSIRVCESSQYCRSYSDTITVGSWNHLLVTLSGTEWNIYLNGVHLGTQDHGIGLNNWAGNFYLGDAYQSGINLDIDDFAIWTRVLSTQEITDIYNGISYTGQFESTTQDLSETSYSVSLDLTYSGAAPKVEFSADGSTWCEIDESTTINYFDCELPTDSFKYKVEFVGMCELDSIQFDFSNTKNACDDLDFDGYDNWDGSYPHCQDDGKTMDCSDNNEFIYPNNVNTYCDCNNVDSYDTGCDDETCGNYEIYCSDGIDNDCDGLVDDPDSDCNVDPNSYEDIDIGFTGIDVLIKGSKNTDYAIERLWSDKSSDDDVIIYMKADTLIDLAHNDHNLKGGGLLADTVHLKRVDDRNTACVFGKVKPSVAISKNYEFDMILEVTDRSDTTFDLTIDDLDTEYVDEVFNDISMSEVNSISSNLIDFTQVNSDAPAIQTQRIHSGELYYRIDADELRTNYDYCSAGNSGVYTGDPIRTSSAMDYMLVNYDENFFRYLGPFDLSSSVGRVGNNGRDLYDDERMSYGVIDEFGDEWHTITVWDNDYKTNLDVDRRDDGSSDGKVIYVVLNPKTPAIEFYAPNGEEYYTTPAKTYYTPHIHERITYLTTYVEIRFHNILNSDSIQYRIDDGNWQTYSSKLIAKDLFSSSNTIYNLEYRYGSNGIIRSRQIHYNPAQPAQSEYHPKLAFNGESDLNDHINQIRGGDSDLTSDYNHDLGVIYEYFTEFPKYIRDLNYGTLTSYFYILKTMAGQSYQMAYYGTIENDETLLKKAKDILLYLYTIDPIGCENIKGRYGGPSQERCMYSDSKVSLRSAAAYDLLFDYTTDNGYVNGMTPIEHIKIRDNLAGEAMMMTKYYGTYALNFWDENPVLRSGSTRNVQLESTITSFGMAMPTYDNHYYGTSGADGRSASHLYAPFSDSVVTWVDLNFNEISTNSNNHNMYRISEYNKLFSSDGWYIGNTRSGYISMLFRDLPFYLNMRKNFDGYEYPRIKNFLNQMAMTRNPFTGGEVSFTFVAGGLPDKLDNRLLIDNKFSDAGLYKWMRLTPSGSTGSSEVYNDVESMQPTQNSIIGDNYVTFTENINSPKTTYLRMSMVNDETQYDSGSFQLFWGGHFDLMGYGERLAIAKAGYHHGDYDYLASNKRRNVIIIDDRQSNNYMAVRGNIENGELSDNIDFVTFATDLENPASKYSVNYAEDINQKRTAIFVDKKYVLMIDRMTSETGTHKYTYQLHGSHGNLSRGGNFNYYSNDDSAIWTKPSGVKLYSEWINDVTLSIGYEFDYVEGNNETFVKADIYAENDNFMTLLYPMDIDEISPTVEKYSSENYDAGRITDSSGTSIIIAKQGSNEVSHYGIETDAEIAFVKLENSMIVDYILIDGTFIEYNSQLIISESSQGTYSSFSSPINNPTHPADSNQDNIIQMGELSSYVLLWKNSNGVRLSDLIEAIRIWKGI